MRSQLLGRSRVLLRSPKSPHLPAPARPHWVRSPASDRPLARSYARRAGVEPDSPLPPPPTSSPDDSLPDQSPPENISPPSSQVLDSPENPPPPPPSTVEVERVRRTRSVTKEELPELPDSLNIVWTPDQWTAENELLDSSFRDVNDVLPPPDILDEALHNLYITLHPQTQHRAAYATSHGSLVEPTLALYCPMEGADYIIDAAVAEMARRTKAEVVVLDAVQLAAGEWGIFGKGTYMHSFLPVKSFIPIPFFQLPMPSSYLKILFTSCQSLRNLPNQESPWKKRKRKKLKSLHQILAQ
jgi:hypothetical protein